MKIAISGSHGLIGSALGARLKLMRHHVFPIVRRSPHQDEIYWDPQKGVIELDKLEGMDAVIHLAGENIASGRWTEQRKRRIWISRVNGTRLLTESLLRLAKPPKVFAVASAVGFYGNRGDDWLDEESDAGDGFLASLCREWEGASDDASKKGIRVLKFRFGVVLSRTGGALAKMLPAFKLGLAGPVGRGDQYMSWIDLDDAVSAISFLLERENLSGVFNLVSPHPVTNKEFTKTLGSLLKRPTILPTPARILRLTLGEMADEMLLASTRVKPSRLLSAGYSFQYPSLRQSLEHSLKK